MKRTLTAACAAGLIALSLAGCSHADPKDVSFEQRVANCKAYAAAGPTEAQKKAGNVPVPANSCRDIVKLHPSSYPEAP